MALYRSSPASLPRYYDGGRYIIGFWPDALRIDTFDPSHLKGDPTLSQVNTPSIQVNYLGSAFWASVLEATGLPITLALEGRSVGKIDENSGYSAAADGHYERDINFARLKAVLQVTGLVFWLTLRATPVLPKEPPLVLTDADRRPKELELELHLSLDVLPEMLMMNERQRDKFTQSILVLQRHAG
jgi:hypothetical protein